MITCMLTCFNLSRARMFEMDAMAVLNFSTAFSSSSSSTNEGLAGIFGGRCIPSDFGMPATTSYITPQAILASYRTLITTSAVLSSPTVHNVLLYAPRENSAELHVYPLLLTRVDINAFMMVLPKLILLYTLRQIRFLKTSSIPGG